MKPKFVFIDRDGVINWDPIGGYIKRAEDFRFLSGVGEALKRLTDDGYRIIVISNQAGVGDGEFTADELEAVHRQFLKETQNAGSSIYRSYYCLHGKRAGCDCRKPETGLFEQAHREIGDFERDSTYYVGDKLSDITAGKRFGLRTVLVLTGHGGAEQEKITEDSRPDHIARDLGSAVEIILRETPNG
jgi:D-glycero-D-manno-heptose 1,7-bisphosphate phosphatase